jgi:hypothetical protein
MSLTFDDAIFFPFMQDIMVCEICGSGSRPDLIANCARCNAYEHLYSFISLPYLFFPFYFFKSKFLKNLHIQLAICPAYACVYAD